MKKNIMVIAMFIAMFSMTTTAHAETLKDEENELLFEKIVKTLNEDDSLTFVYGDSEMNAVFDANDGGRVYVWYRGSNHMFSTIYINGENYNGRIITTIEEL